MIIINKNKTNEQMISKFTKICKNAFSYLQQKQILQIFLISQL